MSTDLLAAAIEIAWRHWTALGVRGVAPIPGYAVDLEALIAFTPSIAAAEPRLASEARDWCLRIGPRHLSVSRLKQLARHFPGPSRADDDLVRDAIVATKRRSKEKTSGKSAEPELMHPALLSLRARRVFGVGARADVIVALLRRRDRPDGAYASDFLSAGYTKRNIAQVLDELTVGGVVKRMDTGNSAIYWLDRDDALVALLAPVPPQIPQWVERLAIVAAILDAKKRNVSRSAVSVAIDLGKAILGTMAMSQALVLPPPRVRGTEASIEAIERWATNLLTKVS